MTLTARDLRVTQAMPYTKVFVARWARRYRMFNSAAYDDLESDCMAAMLALADEWDEQRGVPWEKFLAKFLPRRLIGEIRRRTGRPSHAGFARRQAIDRPLQLIDDETQRRGSSDFAEWWLVRPERGYDDVDDADELDRMLDRLLAGHPARTRSMARDYAAGWTLAEIGVAHDLDESRVWQILRGISRAVVAKPSR